MRSVVLARQARRIVLAAAYGGGGLGVLSAAAAGLLVTEARLARRWVGQPTELPPVVDGRYGAGLPGRALRLAMLGDSSAAGLGVQLAEQTPPGLLAAGLAEAAARPVDLVCAAQPGAQSLHLDAQVTRVLPSSPDVAVVMIGANDVTHRAELAGSVRQLGEAVARLRAAGTAVVVGTCPDLGTVKLVPQPLRWIARRHSRALAAAQTIVVVEAGGRTVSLGDLLGPEFAARPGELFGPDQFHPSPAGYAAAADALLPSVCAAIGTCPPDPRDDHDVQARPVDDAAALAAQEPGTEVAQGPAATEPGPAAAGLATGEGGGGRGRWAPVLLRRRNQPERSASYSPAQP